MLRTTPIRFTDNFEAWERLLSHLGMTKAVTEDGWWEFDSHSGGLRLHSPDHERPAGTTRLCVEVGDLDEFARRTREAGTETVITQEGHGPTATITGPDGVTLTATAATRPPLTEGADPLLHVLGLWYSPQTDEVAATLRHIGARPDISADQGGWHQFTAKNGGLLAAHGGTTSGVVLGFQYDGDAEDLHARLRDAGLEASLVDESYGRTVLVADPDGGEPIWVNERQTDLYGYHRPA
ncbi:hypothetical protein ACPCG0_13075 [Propionibacteriaceae bacterium Y1923]